MKTFCATFAVTTFTLLTIIRVSAADETNSKATLPALTPQTLMSLVHAPQVQVEIGVNDRNRDRFERELRELDAQWWPARLLPVNENRALVARLEKQLLRNVENLLGKAAAERLREIEAQSQGVRVLARPDIAKQLQLDPAQVLSIQRLFESTEKLVQEIDPQQPDAAKTDALKKAQANEAQEAVRLLLPPQAAALQRVYGEKFNTRQLERIYPLAPELVSDQFLHGQTAPRLAALKGKVALVHFYAFQCSNCKANFGHYRRWHDQLKQKGVEVIGIQTPETQAERDPDQIAAAAKKAGLEFPIVVDLDKKNWDAWGNTMWPTVYVVDKNGYIRFWWQGELNWDGATGDAQIEKLVERLLAEK